MDHLTDHLTARLTAHLAARLAARPAHLEPDRGDVPGWVLVTVMSAGIAVALGAVAVPALSDVFTRAVDSVTVGP